MLSYLYRLANGFQQEHGFRPNVLYLNRLHFSRLKNDLANIHGLGELIQFLGMEIVIDNDVPHPHVAYSQASQGRALSA